MSISRLLRRTLFSAFCLMALPAPADEPAKDSVDRDYSAELPRILPKSPAEAMNTFVIANGFRIEQVAAEPLVTDPIAMAFDEEGRLFVVEMRGYSENEADNLGQIRVLEDTDGDGRFDHSVVFADKLSWPTALICYDGGLFVGAAPHIFYLKDNDGDLRADEKRIVFSGFGRSNVQGLVNSFAWGLDSRIHGATSSSGATIKIADSDRTVVLRGRDFSFDPKTLDLQPTSGGGQHGLSFNDWGEKFVCSNSNHIQQVMFADRYVARNPYFAAPGPRVMIAADGPQADVFRASPIEPWRIVRTRLRVKGIVRGPVEGGGTPAGYFTGATGVTIFRGTAWPQQYRGWAVIGDVGSNLVHRKRLVPDKLQYRAERVDKEKEFLTSSDIWFRPVQFANAPDGALYIADMYREVIEHPKSLPPVIKQHLDLNSGRDRGRIYRIVSNDFQQPPLPRLGQASTTQLVASLDHANAWQRETALRLLFEKPARAAVRKLEELAVHGSPQGRMYALYALSSMNALTAHTLQQILESENEYLLAHAIALAESLAASDVELRDQLFTLAEHDSLRVRYQLAFSLGELPSSKNRNAALTKIILRDVDERWVRLAVHSSLNEGAGELVSNLVGEDGFIASSTGQAFIRELARQIGRQQRGDDLATVFRLLSTTTDSRQRILPVIIEGLAAKPGSKLAAQLAAFTGGRAAEITQKLLADAVSVATDDQQSLDQRVDAVRLLGIGGFASQSDVFAELLAPGQPIEVQESVLAALSSQSDQAIAQMLIARWQAMSPRIRSRSGDVLFSRDSWVLILLDAIEAGKIKPSDLAPGRLQLLSRHSDPELRRRGEQLLKSANIGRRGDVVKQYRSVLDAVGDTDTGKAVFKKSCSACHQLDGVGNAVGPNLAAMKNRGAESILLNVLDPNREVNPLYMTYNVITDDGRTLTGMIAAETATSVTLRNTDNKLLTVLRVEIEAMRSSGLSLMPEGLEKEVDKTAMADLIEYLRSAGE